MAATSSDLISLGLPAALAEKIAKRTISFPANAGAVGGTAGWTNANATGTARCPASQTASTFRIPVTLPVGTKIKSFTINGQIESGGNTATLDADLRATTGVAAEPTDASLGAITQVSVTADTLVASSKTLATVATVTAGLSYYILLTATTGASTDIQVLSAEVVVDGI